LAVRLPSRGDVVGRIPQVGQPIRLGLSPRDTIVVAADPP
jgi:hypothetical protein